MTRTASRPKSNAGELSPTAALRTLRSVVYREWDAYRPPVDVPEVPVFEATLTPTLMGGEGDEPRGDWYLNEVPAEWLTGAS